MNIEVRNAYDRRMTVWKTLFIVLAMVFVAQRVSAQAPPFLVQHNGAQQFSANCLVPPGDGRVYNFLDTCTAPPIKPSMIRICDPPILSYRSTNTDGPTFYIWIPTEEIEQPPQEKAVTDVETRIFRFYYFGYLVLSETREMAEAPKPGDVVGDGWHVVAVGNVLQNSVPTQAQVMVEKEGIS